MNLVVWHISYGEILGLISDEQQNGKLRKRHIDSSDMDTIEKRFFDQRQSDMAEN